jgi:serine/threonine protein kinase
MNRIKKLINNVINNTMNKNRIYVLMDKEEQRLPDDNLDNHKSYHRVEDKNLNIKKIQSTIFTISDDSILSFDDNDTVHPSFIDFMVPDVIINKLPIQIKTEYAIMENLNEKLSSTGKEWFYKVKHVKSNNYYFLKVVVKHLNYQYLPEIDLYNMIKKNPHKNILIPEIFIKDGNYRIYLYKYYDSDLFFHILKESKIDNDSIKLIFKQITSAVKYLHDRGIFAGDVKAENVLINDDKINEIVICDFETCIDISDNPNKTIHMKKFNGTPSYYAPESHIHRHFSLKSDIWALGSILYMLITKHPPIDKYICFDYWYKYKERMNDMILFNKEDVTDKIALDLIKKMLNTRADNRILINEVLSHPYINA